MELADKELIAEFVVESQEGLANIENQMLAIEAAGANIDLNLVNAVFRTMHSIKGTSGFMGLDRIGSLAHGLEEVLDDLRNREVIPTSELVTTVLRAADYMKGLIDEVESSNEADVAPYVAELQKFRAGGAGESPVAAAAATIATLSNNVPTAPATSATSAAPPAPLTEAVREFLIECYENLDQMDKDLLAIEDSPTSEPLLRNVFRTIHTIKGGAGFLGFGALERLTHIAETLLSELRDGKRLFTTNIATTLLATVEKCREGLRLVESRGNDDGFDPQPVIQQLMMLEVARGGITAATTPASGANAGEDLLKLGDVLIRQGKVNQNQIKDALDQQEQGDPLHLGEILVEKEFIKSQDIREAITTLQESKAPMVGDSTIRVDVALLDKLMTRVGELVLTRNQILQRTNGLEDAGFVRTAQRLNLITTELQEGVMKTRMQPIGNVWTKFPRVVRDLSAQLSKQVRIEMEGKETELDKTIVEAIKDPLTHLVRNSVDHGIETPEARSAAGKPVEGILLLRAYHEGGQVNIEVSDDGAGLNLERIRKKAVERGIVSADQASRMSDHEAAQIILLPGFSTAEQVTSVSGRGVGMDVVKTNIEKIGGVIDVQSRPGKGTTVKIKIPLTLAIIPALIVTNGGDRYAIPQVSLLELVRLEGEQAERGIEFVHGAPVYRLRGKLLPLVNLSERLGLSQPTTVASEGSQAPSVDKVFNIVILRANDRQFGLIVDKVNDTEEIVVKPLSRQLKSLREFAGATIMGDGNVALILDVMGLAVASGLAGEMRDQSITGALANETKSAQEMHTLLVVDLGDARRFALPTSMISRLEKVPRSSIELADGREVIQYRGAIMPIVRLSEVFGAATQDAAQPEELQIVVYAEQGKSCGLVVNRIVDIVETELNFQSSKSDNDNLLGTTVIQQRVTDVLNLRNLARHESRSGAHTPIAS